MNPDGGRTHSQGSRSRLEQNLDLRVEISGNIEGGLAVITKKRNLTLK
jgi:hypothetical protein